MTHPKNWQILRGIGPDSELVRIRWKPSDDEGAPEKILETMASLTPVVGRSNEGTPEGVDGVGGILLCGALSWIRTSR